MNSGALRWTILNIIYPVLIICLLLYTYVYEIVACQWKLDLHKDTQVSKACKGDNSSHQKQLSYHCNIASITGDLLLHQQDYSKSINTA